MTNPDKSEQFREVSGRLKAGVENKLADIWWYLVLRGILALALGVFALFWRRAVSPPTIRTEPQQ